VWDVELSDFESGSLLSKDLEAYAKRLKRRVYPHCLHASSCALAIKYSMPLCVVLPFWLQPVIEMEMKFPKDYPMNPPFVRIVRPRFRFLTGGQPLYCQNYDLSCVTKLPHHPLSLTYRSCDHWRQYLYADVDQIRLVSIQ